MDEIAETSTNLSEPEENEVPIVASNFQVNRDIIESVAVENQSEELRALGITVYDQSKFEEGILRQVDDALEEQERRKKSKKKPPLSKDGRKEPVVDECVKLQSETEKEKMVRLGQMTPFGTLLKGGKITQELTSFEKYLLEQEKLKNEKVKSTSKKGKSLKSPSVLRELIPVKESRKKRAPVHKKELPNKGSTEKSNAKHSDSDYVPSDEELPKAKAKTAVRKRKRNDVDSEWNTDDSDWEYSDDEETSAKRSVKKPGRVTDDGNINDYRDRLAELPNFGSQNQDCEEFEGGYRIPLTIWNQLYNYQKVRL